MFSSITYDLQPPLATIWLNRPERRNAINTEMLSEIPVCLDSIASRQGIRLVVIRGRGKIFCSGADLEQMKIEGKSAGQMKKEACLFFDCYQAVYDYALPVICLVHGGVYGGGNGFLAAADFACAVEETKISFSEVRLGLVPATIAPFVIKRIGGYMARELLLTGRIIDSKSALKIGLINKIIHTDETDKVIGNLLDEFEQTGPEAVIHTKKLIRYLMEYHQMPDLRNYTTDLISQVRQSKEALKGISSFFKGSKPDWPSLEQQDEVI